ncbi:hypothetical protein [Olivibacter sitiensis]|uniref:hypothetical protein n=1 Tax=Olivibacter sitiensis TaxID=376470 RepID=UPI00040ED8D4|nr:hypothetical protein [Olivibacter sitiensis]
MFTRNELFLLHSAVEEQIYSLRNRFEEEKGYIHPATKYEPLLEKIEAILDTDDDG